VREEIRSQGDEGWRSKAACANPVYDGSWWFPETGGQSHIAQKAKAICKLCPVRFPCLTFGTENNEVGIWGGLNASERRNFATVIKHERALICHGCRKEFKTDSQNVARNIFCSRQCRSQAHRGIAPNHNKKKT